MTQKLKIPKEVINADWKDDIDFEGYGTEKQEREYISPEEVSRESIKRIKARKRGQTIHSIFTKHEKLVA